jgi:hypothetical protein
MFLLLTGRMAKEKSADFWPVFLKTHFANLGVQKRRFFSMKVEGKEGTFSLPFFTIQK